MDSLAQLKMVNSTTSKLSALTMINLITVLSLKRLNKFKNVPVKTIVKTTMWNIYNDSKNRE